MTESYPLIPGAVGHLLNGVAVLNPTPWDPKFVLTVGRPGYSFKSGDTLIELMAGSVVELVPEEGLFAVMLLSGTATQTSPTPPDSSTIRYRLRNRHGRTGVRRGPPTGPGKVRMTTSPTGPTTIASLAGTAEFQGLDGAAVEVVSGKNVTVGESSGTLKTASL